MIQKTIYMISRFDRKPLAPMTDWHRHALRVGESIRAEVEQEAALHGLQGVLIVKEDEARFAMMGSDGRTFKGLPARIVKKIAANVEQLRFYAEWQRQQLNIFSRAENKLKIHLRARKSSPDLVLSTEKIKNTEHAAVSAID